jgi:hypothetical protein
MSAPVWTALNQQMINNNILRCFAQKLKSYKQSNMAALYRQW